VDQLQLAFFLICFEAKTLNYKLSNQVLAKTIFLAIIDTAFDSNLLLRCFSYAMRL